MKNILTIILSVVCLASVIFNIYIYGQFKKVVQVVDNQGQYVYVLLQTPEIQQVINNYLQRQQNNPSTKTAE